MVEITDEMAVGKDEIYAMFYRCPKCNREYLIDGYNFCPDCGVALHWRVTEIKW